MDIAAEKKRLRALALGRRAGMGAGVREAASRVAAGHALAALGPVAGRTVAAFAPFRDEIDTAPLTTALRRAGARLALPVIVGRGHPLIFRLWDAAASLTPAGAYGIPEPGPEAPEVIPDVVLVPLAAFDRRGYRIGYGAGFYDRTLHLLRQNNTILTLGFAFACQEVEAVPIESHDEAVDMMITESAALACAGARSGQTESH